VSSPKVELLLWLELCVVELGPRVRELERQMHGTDVHLLRLDHLQCGELHVNCLEANIAVGADPAALWSKARQLRSPPTNDVDGFAPFYR